MAGAITSTNNITLPTISARLTHIFSGGMREALNSKTDLFSELRSRGRIKKGKGPKVEVKIHYGRNTAGWNTETGSIGAAGYQQYINGYEAWTLLQVPFQVTDLKMDVAYGATADGIASILEDEISRAVDDLVVKAEASLWGLQSDLSNSCLGIQDAVYDGSTGSYLNIDRAAYAMMQNHVLSTGANRSLSKALLNDACRLMMFGSGSDKSGSTADWEAEDQGGSKPTHILTTGGIVDQYDENVLGANPRFLIDRGAKGGADAGVIEATFKNTKFLASRFAPANQLRFIDINDFELHILPHYYSIRGEDKVRESEIAVKYLGRDGSYLKGYLELRVQFICAQNVGNQVLLDDITE